MPSNQTTNYNLSQWSKSDQVLMEDFNADNAKIDAAIKAVADSKANASALAALTTLVGVPVRLAAGSYTGNGSSSQTIYTGFTPKAVYVCTEEGFTYISNVTSIYYGGLAVTASPAGYSDKKIVEIVSGGFQVFSSSGVGSNQSRKFHYVAIG